MYSNSRRTTRPYTSTIFQRVPTAPCVPSGTPVRPAYEALRLAGSTPLGPAAARGRGVHTVTRRARGSKCDYAVRPYAQEPLAPTIGVNALLASGLLTLSSAPAAARAQRRYQSLLDGGATCVCVRGGRDFTELTAADRYRAALGERPGSAALAAHGEST